MARWFARENETPLHFLTVNGNKYRCSIGRGGVIQDKKEGDDGTPSGSFQIREIYYRPDRIKPIELQTDIPLIPLTPNDGWCDDVTSPQYNQFVKLPFGLSHEKLWFDAPLYDIIGVLSYNVDPIVNGKGSAIFLHIATKDYTPTAGCVALSKEDLLSVISQFSKDDTFEIHSSGNVQVIKSISQQLTA